MFFLSHSILFLLRTFRGPQKVGLRILRGLFFFVFLAHFQPSLVRRHPLPLAVRLFPSDLFSRKIPRVFFLRHKTSHNKIVEQPLILFSRNSFLFSIDYPVLCLFGWDSSFLEEFGFCSPFLPKSLVSICSGLQQFISFGPILCLAYPEHFSTCQNFSLPVRSSDQVMTSHMMTSSFSPSFRKKTKICHICLAFSCICFLFRISYIDTCSLPRTTLFDASFSPFSCRQNSTFLSALA